MRKITETGGRYGLILAVHLTVVLVWYLFVDLGEVPSYVMPTPQATILSLGEEYNWVHNTLITAGEIFGGYVLAVIVGVSLALLFSWFRLLNNMLMPLLVSCSSSG